MIPPFLFFCIGKILRV